MGRIGTAAAETAGTAAKDKRGLYKGQNAVKQRYYDEGMHGSREKSRGAIRFYEADGFVLP